MSLAKPAYAVIVAGGNGTRMGTDKPKQFLLLAGQPVLYWSIKAFVDAVPGVRIILVLPEAFMEDGRATLESLPLPPTEPLQIVTGGETRFASVAAGLAQVPDDAIVFVHDAARPMVTPALIQRCLESANTHGSAIPVIEVADSIRQVTAEGSHSVHREQLRVVQTPQTFNAALLKAAFRGPYSPAFTDEANVIQHNGGSVWLVPGERSNFKITTPEDLVMAEAVIRGRVVSR